MVGVSPRYSARGPSCDTILLSASQIPAQLQCMRHSRRLRNEQSNAYVQILLSKIFFPRCLPPSTTALQQMPGRGIVMLAAGRAPYAQQRCKALLSRCRKSSSLGIISYVLVTAFWKSRV